MQFAETAIHVTVRCDFCDADNELTARNLSRDATVSCSTCGKSLGTVQDLLGRDNQQQQQEWGEEQDQDQGQLSTQSRGG